MLFAGAFSYLSAATQDQNGPFLLIGLCWLGGAATLLRHSRVSRRTLEQAIERNHPPERPPDSMGYEGGLKYDGAVCLGRRDFPARSVIAPARGLCARDARGSGCGTSRLSQPPCQ